MMRLILEKGLPADAVLEIPEGESVVGRSHSAQLQIEAGDVSGRHFRLWRNGPVVEVENLSQYGTYVDGDPVTGR
ncbi:MAG: FHA domain-containing protein, partial [Lentisphaeria bacterium]